MTALPSSLALAPIADNSSIIASDHRTNYAAIQTALNSLLSIFGGGAAGQVLQSGGPGAVAFAAPAAGTFYRKTTVKTVVNTVTETDLLNGEITVAAGAMGVSGLLRLTVLVDLFNNSGGNVTYRFKLKLGATTVFDSGTYTIGAGANRGPLWFEARGMNLGAANAQAWNGSIALADGSNTMPGGTAFTSGEGGKTVAGTFGPMPSAWFNTSAEDTSALKALALTVTMGTASANAEAKLSGALVEVI